MSKNFTVDSYEAGRKLCLRTPGEYSMDIAIELLWWFEKEFEGEVPDTGWKSGFGLSPGSPVQIRTEEIEIALDSNGEFISITRVSGRKAKFGEVCEAILELA